jgi:Pyruvate/2-oxoacid:ferredoxin oxidoreductase gamma subunit
VTARTLRQIPIIRDRLDLPAIRRLPLSHRGTEALPRRDRAKPSLVMVGAAPPFLPIRPRSLETFANVRFQDPDVIQANVAAFRAGRAAGEQSSGEAGR